MPENNSHPQLNFGKFIKANKPMVTWIFVFFPALFEFSSLRGIESIIHGVE